MLTITTLTSLVNQLDHEELDYLVHGYDAYLINCEREERQPLSMLDYFKTEDYQDLVESGDIEDLREYESYLEDASVEEMRELALTFEARVQAEIATNEVYYQRLDHLIDELEVGSLITEEEAARLVTFENQLRLHGYLPTMDGSLKLVSNEAGDDYRVWDFIWDDYQKAHEALINHPDHVHAITILDGGRYSIATSGWRYVNRMGYILTNQPILTETEDVMW